jgi:hypothetical protein
MKCPFFLEHTRFRTRAPPPATHTHTHTHPHTQSVCSCLAKHWNLCTCRLGGGGGKERISGGLVSGRVSSKQRQLTMAVFVPPRRRYMCENVKQYTQATCMYLSFVYMPSAIWYIEHVHTWSHVQICVKNAFRESDLLFNKHGESRISYAHHVQTRNLNYL